MGLINVTVLRVGRGIGFPRLALVLAAIGSARHARALGFLLVHLALVDSISLLPILVRVRPLTI